MTLYTVIKFHHCNINYVYTANLVSFKKTSELIAELLQVTLPFLL